MPQPPKPAIEDLVSISKESRLDEVVPMIDSISFKRSSTTIEVFIEAWAYTDCYDKLENVVELRQNYTRIVPRRSRTKSGKACSMRLKKFSEKVAELDAADPASQEVHILGFRGWHVRKIEPTEVPVPPAPTPEASPKASN